MTERLEIKSRVEDQNEVANGPFVPPGMVRRHVVFTINLEGKPQSATMEAMFAGTFGQPLVLDVLLRDDWNLSPKNARELAQAIYDGHYGVEDHATPKMGAVLSGELNVEPYWEASLRERLAPAS